MASTVHVVQWRYPGGRVESADCRGLGAADARVFQLGARSPQPRVWLDGEVQHDGEGFNAPAARMPQRGEAV